MAHRSVFEPLNIPEPSFRISEFTFRSPFLTDFGRVLERLRPDHDLEDVCRHLFILQAPLGPPRPHEDQRLRLVQFPSGGSVCKILLPRIPKEAELGVHPAIPNVLKSFGVRSHFVQDFGGNSGFLSEEGRHFGLEQLVR